MKRKPLPRPNSRASNPERRNKMTTWTNEHGRWRTTRWYKYQQIPNVLINVHRPCILIPAPPQHEMMRSNTTPRAKAAEKKTPLGASHTQGFTGARQSNAGHGPRNPHGVGGVRHAPIGRERAGHAERVPQALVGSSVPVHLARQGAPPSEREDQANTAETGAASTEPVRSWTRSGERHLIS